MIALVLILALTTAPQAPAPTTAAPQAPASAPAAPQAPAPAAAPPGTPPQTPVPPPAPAQSVPPPSAVPGLDADAWRALVERDATLGFTRTTARQAREALDRGIAADTDRAAALFALGATDAWKDRVRLEEAAQSAEGAERRAAILALGELTDPPIPLLVSGLSHPNLQIRGSSALALARSGDPAADRRLQPLVALPEVGAQVRRLLAFAEDPYASEPDPVSLQWLTLRYEAAKRYGLVEGRSWRAATIDRLGANDGFLDSVVLRDAANSAVLLARDHLASMLLDEPSPAVIDAAVRAIPSEVAALVENGLWLPADPEAWEALLDAIDETGRAFQLAPLLQTAMTQPGLKRRAAELLVAAGVSEAWQILAPAAKADDPLARRSVALALGRSGDARWSADLELLEIDPHPDVAAAASVARVQLGDEEVALGVAKDLAGDDTDRVAALARALADVGGRDATLLDLLELARAKAPEREALAAAIALVDAFRFGARAQVYDALDDGSARHQAAKAVRALGRQPEAGDLVLFERLFPNGADAELDRELARALLRNNRATGTLLLRRALWRPRFHAGVLAALALADREGIEALHEELQAPPRGARGVDLRRVGWAIGAYGGAAEVERLGRRLPSSDPALQGAYLGALAARTY